MMSKEYDEYLENHIAGVATCFKWMERNISHIFQGIDMLNMARNIRNHDKSKRLPDEYAAYDAYFYGAKVDYPDPYDIEQKETEFNVAWLKHIHRNPHHWQHWVLINDNPNEGIVCIEMPREHVIEMVCDWWSFSWRKNNLEEIFNWYEAQKDYILLHKDTRIYLESVLEAIAWGLLEVGV